MNCPDNVTLALAVSALFFGPLSLFFAGLLWNNRKPRNER